MSDFNAIGNPFLAAGIPRLYGVDVPSVPVVGSEVQITTSPWERPEFWALMGGGLGWGSIEVAAGGAGTRSKAQLYNLPGSGVLLVLEELILGETATKEYLVGISTTILSGSSGAWVNRDLRRASTTGGSGGLSARIRQENNTGGTGFGSQIFLLIARDIPYSYRLNCVLPPGWGVTVCPASDNTVCRANFIGRERFAPPPELTLL